MAPQEHAHAGRAPHGLSSPARRALTIGLVLGRILQGVGAGVGAVPAVAFALAGIGALAGIALTRRLPLHELVTSAAREAVADVV